MNFDDLQAAWNSPQNRPPPAEIAQDRTRFVHTLRRRRFGFCVIVSLSSAWIVALLVRFGLFIARGGTFDPSRENIALLMLLAPLVAAVALLALYRRHVARHVDCEHSLQTVLRALLDENRFARTRSKIIGTLLAATSVALPFAVKQIQAVGKAGKEIEILSLVGPLLLGAVVVALAVDYRRRLIPQGNALMRQLAEYPAC